MLRQDFECKLFIWKVIQRISRRGGKWGREGKQPIKVQFGQLELNPGRELSELVYFPCLSVITHRASQSSTLSGRSLAEGSSFLPGRWIKPSDNLMWCRSWNLARHVWKWQKPQVYGGLLTSVAAVCLPYLLELVFWSHHVLFHHCIWGLLGWTTLWRPGCGLYPFVRTHLPLETSVCDYFL